MEILQKFVAFSEYMNFTENITAIFEMIKLLSKSMLWVSLLITKSILDRLIMPLCGQKDKDIGKRPFSKYFWLEEIRV